MNVIIDQKEMIINEKLNFNDAVFRGSGKTTWCKDFIKNKNIKYISRDEIRFSLLEERDKYFSKEDEVVKTFIQQINEGLKTQNVIADATHLTAKSRKMILNQITTPYSEIIVVYIKTKLRVALRRNKKRMGRAYVPEDIIRKMYYEIEIPTEKENIDELWTVETSKQSTTYLKLKQGGNKLW